jgi:DNA-binding transcriptional LysR family regulator
VPSSNELDWDDLRYFLRAASATTLAGAARVMGVEHTTIGRRLASLERTLGAPLVLRSPDGLKLTPLGSKVLPLVENVERAVREVENAVRSEKVRVRLAVPSGFTKYFTAELPKLRAEHPEIELELISGARPVDLKKGEADLSLRSGPVEDDDLVIRKVADSCWSLYASDAYLARHPGPIDLDDLAGHELIGYDTLLARVPAAKWIEDRSERATIVLRSREMTDMAAAASTGAGIAALPCGIGDEEPSLRRLTPHVIASRAVALVYRREVKLSDHVRAVIDFVIEVMEQASPRMSGQPPPTE